MQNITGSRKNFFNFRATKTFSLIAALSASVLVVTSIPSQAATAINLGSADSFAILAGQTITSTGPTIVTGDIGLHPGTALVETPTIVHTGTKNLTDAVALAAKNSLVTAYNDAAAANPPTETITADLGGRTLVSGIYKSASGLGLTGTLTLDAQGDPNAVWIFQAASTLITASASSVVITNAGVGAEPAACNVFWQVGSSATLGTSSTMLGTVMALTSIAAETNAVIQGRLLAQNGAVTLDSNTITRPACIAKAATATATPAPATATPATATPAPKAKAKAQVGKKPTGSVATGDNTQGVLSK